MLLPHDHELMAMDRYCCHTSSFLGHIMFLPRVLKRVMGSTWSLSISLPPHLFPSSSVVDLAPARRTLESEGAQLRVLGENGRRQSRGGHEGRGKEQFLRKG